MGSPKVGETLVELRPCRVEKWVVLACLERIIPHPPIVRLTGFENNSFAPSPVHPYCLCCTVARPGTCLPSCSHRGHYRAMWPVAASNTLCSTFLPPVPHAHHAKRHAWPAPPPHRNPRLRSPTPRNHRLHFRRRKVANQYGRFRSSSRSSSLPRCG